jgi:aminoglycoside phosphotransferase (APT) family kinase protein
VLGAPFYLMSFVDGKVLDTADAVRAVPSGAARRVGELLIDTLLALHEVDPRSVGLGDFGRPDGFLGRQLGRWHQQWTASQTRPLADVQRVADQLGATLPPQSAPGITHGDYRVGNVIYAPDLTRIAAVIDWEMATVGDPLADLGLLIVYHTLAADGGFGLAPLRAADGFRTPAALADRYRNGSSRDLRYLSWYVAFGYFKLAVITETIRRRHQEGRTVGEGFDELIDTVPLLLRSASASLAAASWREE